jgi:hypothetical protein
MKKCKQQTQRNSSCIFFFHNKKKKKKKETESLKKKSIFIHLEWGICLWNLFYVSLMIRSSKGREVRFKKVKHRERKRGVTGVFVYEWVYVFVSFYCLIFFFRFHQKSWVRSICWYWQHVVIASPQKETFCSLVLSPPGHSLFHFLYYSYSVSLCACSAYVTYIYIYTYNILTEISNWYSD